MSLGVFPFFTIVSRDEERIAIALGGALTESPSIAQQIPDHNMDDGNQAQSHVYQERPEAFDVTCTVSAAPFEDQVSDWRDTCDTLGFKAFAPLASSGQLRLQQVWNAIRSERKRLWTLYTGRHGILDDYMIVTASETTGDTTSSELKLSFKAVKFIKSESVFVQAPTPRARTVKAEDRFGTSEILPEDYYSNDPHEQPDRSVLYAAYQSGNGTEDLDSAFSELGKSFGEAVSVLGGQ